MGCAIAIKRFSTGMSLRQTPTLPADYLREREAPRAVGASPHVHVLIGAFVAALLYVALEMTLPGYPRSELLNEQPLLVAEARLRGAVSSDEGQSTAAEQLFAAEAVHEAAIAAKAAHDDAEHSWWIRLLAQLALLATIAAFSVWQLSFKKRVARTTKAAIEAAGETVARREKRLEREAAAEAAVARAEAAARDKAAAMLATEAGAKAEAEEKARLEAAEARAKAEAAPGRRW